MFIVAWCGVCVCVARVAWGRCGAGLRLCDLGVCPSFGFTREEEEEDKEQ